MAANPKPLTEQDSYLPSGFSYEVTHATLGEILKLGHSMIGKLREKGMPQVRRNVYDLRECVPWYVDQWRHKHPGDASEESTRAALNRAQREKVELENAKLRGDLIPVDEARQITAALMSATCSRLDGLPAAAGIEFGADVQDWLTDEVRAIRQQIAESLRREAPNLTPAATKKTARKKATRKKTAKKKTTRKAAA